MRHLAATALAALTLAAPASAHVQLTTPAGAPAGGTAQACANRVQTATVATVTLSTDNPYAIARQAYAIPGTIFMPTEWASLADCGDLWHELGHQFDYARLTDYDRDRIMRALHLHGAWRQPVNSPHEQFAEVYRIAATHATLPQDVSMAYGLHVSPNTFAMLRSWLVNYDRAVRDEQGRPTALR